MCKPTKYVECFQCCQLYILEKQMLSNSWQSWNFLSSNDKNDDRKQMFLKYLALILKVLNPGKIFHVARNPFVVYTIYKVSTYIVL